MRNGKLSYINIVITVNDDGYLAQCPGIQGAFAEGDTIEEAIFNCVDVLKMIEDYRKERSETINLNALHSCNHTTSTRLNPSSLNPIHVVPTTTGIGCSKDKKAEFG